MRASPRISVLMGERAVAPHPNRPGNGLSGGCLCSGGLFVWFDWYPLVQCFFGLVNKGRVQKKKAEEIVTFSALGAGGRGVGAGRRSEVRLLR